MRTQGAYDLKEAGRALDGIQEDILRETYRSQIWQAAIDRYYEELRIRGVKGPSIDHDVWSIHSPEDLLQQMNDLAPNNSVVSSQWVGTLRRLEPVLLNLNGLVAVITLALEMQGQLAAIIWGSIRLILKFARPVLPEFLDMFEELGRALPRVRKHEQDFPITEALEEALVATYT